MLNLMAKPTRVISEDFRCPKPPRHPKEDPKEVSEAALKEALGRRLSGDLAQFMDVYGVVIG